MSSHSGQTSLSPELSRSCLQLQTSLPAMLDTIYHGEWWRYILHIGKLNLIFDPEVDSIGSGSQNHTLLLPFARNQGIDGVISPTNKEKKSSRWLSLNHVEKQQQHWPNQLQHTNQNSFKWVVCYLIINQGGIWKQSWGITLVSYD
jgi:hypothetical protein